MLCSSGVTRSPLDYGLRRKRGVSSCCRRRIKSEAKANPHGIRRKKQFSIVKRASAFSIMRATAHPRRAPDPCLARSRIRMAPPAASSVPPSPRADGPLARSARKSSLDSDPKRIADHSRPSRTDPVRPSRNHGAPKWDESHQARFLPKAAMTLTFDCAKHWLRPSAQSWHSVRTRLLRLLAGKEVVDVFADELRYQDGNGTTVGSLVAGSDVAIIVMPRSSSCEVNATSKEDVNA